MTYKGRSGCCAGIDQIVFQVPEGLDGCYVPVVAKIGNAVSNFTTMSVSASGGACSDAGGLSASDIQAAQRNNKIRLGILDLFRADIELVTGASTGVVTRYDQASAVFTDLTFGELLGMPVREISTPGSCTVWRGNANDAILNRPPILAPHINLDAGTITVQGAAGSSAMNYRGDYYSALLGTASSSEPPSGPGPTSGFLEPGTFTVSSPGGGPIPGGKLIGAFNAQIAVTAPPRFDNRFAVGDVQRGQGVTVNWSGVDAGALVEIRGVSAPERSGGGGRNVFLRGEGGRRAVHHPSERLAEPAGCRQFHRGERERAGPECRSDRGGALHRAGRGRRPASLQFGVRAECQFSLEVGAVPDMRKGEGRFHQFPPAP